MSIEVKTKGLYNGEESVKIIEDKTVFPMAY